MRIKIAGFYIRTDEIGEWVDEGEIVNVQFTVGNKKNRQ